MSPRTSTARVAVTAALLPLAVGCSGDESANPSEDGPASAASPTSTDQVELPDGVLPLPERDPGSDFASLEAGRYRIALSDTLAFDVDVPDDTSAHDDGLFLATGRVILKTELAGEEYGVPRDPCTDQSIDPVGPTVDDLAQALRDLPIYQVTRPERVELGGADAIYLEARIPRTYDASQCEGEDVQLPGNPATAVSFAPPYIGRWWILDVDGQRVVVQQNCWGCRADELDRGTTSPESITFTPTP